MRNKPYIEDRFLALDTEDDSKGNIFLINFFDGVKHTTFGGDERIAAWNWLKEQGPVRVWACNMEYDLINLFGEWADKFLTLTFNESAFIKANWGGYRITFLDTLRHWMIGVKAMGEFLKLEKLEPSGKGAKYDDLKYCRRDTEIVWRFVDEMTGRYGQIGADVRNTLPSSAFKFFKDKFNKVDITRPSDEICDLLMGAAYGGRAEIFKTGVLEGPIDCYDVNSLYPWVMANALYPAPATGEMVDTLDLKRECIARVAVDMPPIGIPCLPVRHEGRLVFPVGRFVGTWTAPELRQAVKDGATILKVEWVYQYQRTCRPFKEYVNYIYNLRKATKDEFLSYTLKIFLNSVFGKFTESGELIIFKNGEMTTLSNRPVHSNVALGAYTTAYGRLRLLESLRAYEKELCYCDTDSVFLQQAPSLKTGKELGQWKYEGRFRLCHFILPKTYLAVKEDGTKKYKAKGIPKKAMEEFFENFSVHYDSPIRFRESKRRSMTPNVWISKVRSLKAKYEKRLMVADGKTLPLTINSL